ncbi:MAG: Plasmid stabilization system protein [Spirochaetes bacterium ADurb.Bin315]|jgi:addiction module RelE/StbE family toxin|nr:MAG: Plasmid stabilization system protein [Spirochaetes bacterium ADurb.Bin315]
MYEIQLTSLAKEDLILATSYISYILKAPATAGKLLDTIEHEVEALSENPYMFSTSRDENLAHRGIRHFSVKNYMLFYTIKEETKTVTVLRFLHARRNWIQLLGHPSL